VSLFRRKTIFHAEESAPDPEELKLRFRRRVLLLTFLGFVAVLAVPVFRELQDDLGTRRQARRFAEEILDARMLASEKRAPVSLELQPDNRTWKRILHNQGTDCTAPPAGQTETWASKASWKVQMETEKGETLAGRSLCLQPLAGLLLDTTPVATGKLLVTAATDQGNQWKESAYLLVSQFGAEIEMVTNWNH
jgi:hypothetical protein